MSNPEKAKQVEKHTNIPAGVYDERQIRDYLRDRFTRDTMSDRAVDVFAEEISDLRQQEVGTPDAAAGEAAEAVWDAEAGTWRDPDTGRFL